LDSCLICVMGASPLSASNAYDFLPGGDFFSSRTPLDLFSPIVDAKEEIICETLDSFCTVLRDLTRGEVPKHCSYPLLNYFF